MRHLLITLPFLIKSTTLGFITSLPRFIHKHPTIHNSFLPLSKETDEIDVSTRFTALLRDLQIENVPILGCDANNVFALSAALWTTISEMNESDSTDKACLVMENIPVRALEAFVKELEILKKQERLMKYLPELNRVSAILLDKGKVGSAILIETKERNAVEIKEKEENISFVEGLDEMKCTLALQRFVQRMFVDLETKPIVGTQSLRFSSTMDVCTALAIFWTCMCELQNQPTSTQGSILLSLPGIAPASHDRFAAVAEVIGHQLSLFECDSIYDLTFCHPQYERKVINPVDDMIYGHLPPPSYLRPILRSSDNANDSERLTWDELNLINYARRSPHTIIRIDRKSGKKSEVIDLDLGGGKMKKVSGVKKYAKIMVTLANVGESELESASKDEIELQQTP